MNKIVVITGGNSGIGKCTAEMFRKKGETVLSVSKDIDKDYPEFSFKCDVSNEEEVKNVVTEIGEKFGRIDVLVNNAGFGVNGALELIPTETVTSIMNVNILGAIIVTKHCLPFMGKGSKIINMSSISGVFPAPFRSVYCFSKSALLMLSLSQRMELERVGIDVCAICPGEVQTGFMKKRVRVTDTNERYGKQVERAFAFLDKHDGGKRMGPEKVAKAVLKQTYRKKSKPFVIVGAPFKLIYAGIKLLPISWVLKITNKYMGGGTIE